MRLTPTASVCRYINASCTWMRHKELRQKVNICINQHLQHFKQFSITSYRVVQIMDGFVLIGRGLGLTSLVRLVSCGGWWRRWGNVLRLKREEILRVDYKLTPPTSPSFQKEALRFSPVASGFKPLSSVSVIDFCLVIGVEYQPVSAHFSAVLKLKKGNDAKLAAWSFYILIFTSGSFNRN